MPVTFIGDVHGWNGRLTQLLGRSEGQLILMGDLIDRGPEAPAVLDRVHAWCSSGRARCLMGNHEWMLVRSLGLGDAEPDADAFAAWAAGWGGASVLRSYGVADPASLKRALRPHWEWLGSLPWVLESEVDGRAWIAVHAALDPQRPTAPQLAELRLGWAGPWSQSDDERPLPLFRKAQVERVPGDFPTGTCLVSGHTPRLEPLVTAQRILCDTSGGLPGRPLTGVVFPRGQVLHSVG
jgi:hypothetical protein